ncbi:hypothetical protein JIN78_16975 [Roseibacillus ishigakijimensis]|uniref:Uncharacterized protein n=1 Tax=Roseibacillus ishigakijimensis TaxID=454146 RepID=A0A934VMH7_9BACT|nr:hypothetical protein [Roseibacillus ishigakijimensis]MBK1835759.1 hypothetical protein [Roseibacillus ishigakijimensis]
MKILIFSLLVIFSICVVIVFDRRLEKFSPEAEIEEVDFLDLSSLGNDSLGKVAFVDLGSHYTTKIEG